MSASICANEITILDGVYEPREDSYLTCICVEYVYRKALRRVLTFSPLRCVEVGSGTGIISIKIVLTCLEENIKPQVISIDIDLKACKNTLLNIKKFNIDKYVDIICCDSTTCIRENSLIHVLVSNPPYLPEDDYCRDYRICAGPDGRALIDRIVSYFLQKDIKILMLTQSSLSDYMRTLRLLQERPDVDAVLVGKLHLFFEDIVTITGIKYLQRERFKKTNE